MTPRDYYAAAALTGLLVAKDLSTQDAIELSINVADRAVLLACDAWGHDMPDGCEDVCLRCGRSVKEDP